MPLEMVHGDCRDLQRVSQRRGQRPADHQGSNQARAGRIGNRVQVAELDAGVHEHRLDHRQQLRDMVAGRKLRHDAAIGGMEGDLAREPLGPNAEAGLVEGYARLVAARF
jgi:hypothetical protein